MRASSHWLAVLAIRHSYCVQSGHGSICL
jgi:hypothetical protein